MYIFCRSSLFLNKLYYIYYLYFLFRSLNIKECGKKVNNFYQKAVKLKITLKLALLKTEVNIGCYKEKEKINYRRPCSITIN